MSTKSIRRIYKFIYTLLLHPEKLFENFVVGSKCFLLEIAYAISLRGQIIFMLLSFSYILGFYHLFSMGLAECVDTKVDTEENLDFLKRFDHNTKLILTKLENNTPFIFQMLMSSFDKALEIDVIDLCDEGIFEFKIDYSNFPCSFPLYKLSDKIANYEISSAEIEERGSPFCSLFLDAVKDPTVKKVTLAGSYINALYLSSVDLLINPISDLEIQNYGWNSLVSLAPAAFEFQVETYNQFLEIIGYPYRVEDFREGSAYDLADMYVHEHAFSHFDPFYAETPMEDESVTVFKRKFNDQMTKFHHSSDWAKLQIEKNKWIKENNYQYAGMAAMGLGIVITGISGFVIYKCN